MALGNINFVLRKWSWKHLLGSMAEYFCLRCLFCQSEVFHLLWLLNMKINWDGGRIYASVR